MRAHERKRPALPPRDTVVRNARLEEGGIGGKGFRRLPRARIAARSPVHLGTSTRFSPLGRVCN
jgi:hypothetical protein